MAKFTRAVLVTKSDTEYITNPSEPSTAATATGAIIVINNGAVTSVTLANAGIGYLTLGNFSISLAGAPGSGATLAPQIVGGSIMVGVTNGGSLYTDGTYISGSTYTLTVTPGTATRSNNVIPIRPAKLYIDGRVSGTLKVTTSGGDIVTFTVDVPTGGICYEFPVDVIQVWSTGTTMTGDIMAMW